MLFYVESIHASGLKFFGGSQGPASCCVLLPCFCCDSLLPRESTACFINGSAPGAQPSAFSFEPKGFSPVIAEEACPGPVHSQGQGRGCSRLEPSWVQAFFVAAGQA